MPEDTKRHIIAAFSTLLFSIVVFLILWLFGLKRPFPPPAEYGVEVNLGYSDVGMGDMQAIDPMAENIEAVSPSSSSSSEIEEVLTTKEEAPSLKEKKNTQKQSTTKVRLQEQNPKQENVKESINTMALYKGKRQGTEVSSQGNTNQSGDMGKEDGDINAKGYAGRGGSGGISFSLSGRTLMSLVKPSYNSEEQGLVVVRIWVNQQGVVTRAQVGIKGTTTMDENLWETAKNAAMQSRFTYKENAPSEQIGTITYKFVRAQ
ncbi:MAG: energy transducer TonB [Bacteroidales bacterium]